jgi:hypothetical protein
MKIKAPLTVAGVVLFGAFVTGCSQQQQQADASQSQSQNADAGQSQSQNADAGNTDTAPAPAKPKGGNCHSHPENSSRGTVEHCHPYPGNGPHSHLYGQGSAKPQIDVAELQRRLKAKGYYKGPIDGNLSADTKNALAAYQNR